MLTLQLLTIEEVSFATLQCGLHPLRRVRISNTGSLPLTDLRVVVKTAPRFLEREEYALPSVGAGESIDLIPRLTDGLSSYLLTLREAEEGVVSVGVLKGEEVLAASEVRLTLLPLTVWMGTEVTPTLHAAYVEGGHPALTRILQRANKYLERTEDKLPLCGYEIGTVDGVRKQVAALYHALSQEGITVGSDPAVKGCPVRSYDRLLEEKIGSCLDISLFFAGILEAAGFNPILIFTDRYVEVGVWLSPRTFPESVQDDAEQILRRAALGIDEICVIDPACACANVRFDTGCETALARLKGAQNFLYALDIRRARLSGIPALPARKPAPDGSIVYYPQNARQDVALGADVTPGGTPLTRDRLWERRLLDLSLRNSLLNFLPERRGVPLFASSVGELATLCNRGGDWLLSPRPQETVSEDPLPPITGGLPEALLHSESLQGRIRTAYREEPLKTKLNGLYRTARTSLEESGANPLYLSIGFLKWYENEHSKVPRYAPLVLLPAELVRKNAPRGFALRLREEEPTFNVTLLEFLKSDFDLQLPIPDTLPRGDWGINLQLLFNTVRRAVLDRRGWDVVESASLAAFSFGRFILWNDLHNRKDILRQNRIVSGLIEGGAHGIPQVKFPTADDLDGLGDPTLIAAPLPADSSQLSAIAAAGVGASFVLHGPPGTGKSQTITNMIANALYTGKTVLFVADKMAALSVVESRLAALGLSPFCLELHSDKAKKSHVLEQLSATLESGAQERPVAFEKMAERLASERDRLRGTLHLLHRTHPSGMSLYDAIVGYERYLDAKEVPCFPRERVAETTAETYRDTLIAIREYGAAADRAGGVNAHPLSFYEKRTANPEDKATLTAALEGYLGSADCFTRQYEILSDLLPLGRIHAYDQIKSLAELCKKLSEMTVLPAGLVSHPQLLGMKLTVDCLRRAGEERNLLREELLTRFDSDLLAQNAGDAIRAVREADLSNLLTRPAKRKKERVKLAVFAKDPSSLSWADVMPVWESVAQYQALGEEIETLCATAATLFGGLARGKDSDTVYLGKLYDDACAVKHLANATVLREEDLTRLLTVLDGLASDGSLLSHCDTFRTFVSAFEDLNAAEERVASACACEAGSLRILTDWPASETLRFRRGLQKLDDLRDYVIYLNKRDILWQYGLKPLTDALEDGRIHTPDLLPAFLRSSCLSIAEEILVSDPALSSFSGAVTGEQIRLYRETSKQFRRLTASEIIARLSARIPHPDESAEIALELGTLNRAIRAGGRGMSLRKLFDSIPHVLPRLSPCMLMSPLSVAQYVSAELPPFDLVIFDEASQMPTCEAVSAIARGKSLIVVGDPNQLPPTSFFTATHGEDEGDAEILESLLDDCLALGMPEQHLAWHYRSRHESLITFSNRSYYGNRLSTFPSPTAPVSHVRTVHVGGCYDRGKTKTNRAEAEAVVSEVLRRLSQKETPPTMGIVTFASPQQALIEDLLEERLASDPALARKAEGLREPIFVKNLENVQGDERDVIFFSVCYGPDKQGRVALNFGPLNREGGWRRLNVAVTRAREEMLVFSTLLPEQIDLSRTTSEGVAGLRAFLEYARSGEVAMTPDAERHERPTEIAHAVAKALAARGYETDTHVGTSDCRVDVAIRDPQREGEYLLGILTDERAAGSVGDRFEIREQTLARLGWSLYRLWSIDYWDAPAKILDQIEAICHTANKMRAGRGVLALDPLPTPQEPVADGVQQTYASPAVTATAAPTHRRSYLGAIKRETYPTEKLRPLPEGKRNTATFFSPEERETVLFQIRELLLREAPISHNLLCKRICEAWGIRLTPRADGYLTTLVGQTVCTPRDRGGVRFYWNLGQEASEYATFRLPLSPADRREPEDIPLEEMASAIAHLAESHGSLSREDTLRDTARMFGFARIPAPLETRLDAALELAVRRATVAVRDGRVLAESIL